MLSLMRVREGREVGRSTSLCIYHGCFCGGKKRVVYISIYRGQRYCVVSVQSDNCS